MESYWVFYSVQWGATRSPLCSDYWRATGSSIVFSGELLGLLYVMTSGELLGLFKGSPFADAMAIG